jgi:hypothetical protein
MTARGDRQDVAHLGAVVDSTLAAVRRVFDAAYIFPMGAVAKPLEPDKLRPTDDHTRTGLNAACDMSACDKPLADRHARLGSSCNARTRSVRDTALVVLE